VPSPSIDTFVTMWRAPGAMLGTNAAKSRSSLLPFTTLNPVSSEPSSVNSAANSSPSPASTMWL
jgi:hypothetical protein